MIHKQYFAQPLRWLLGAVFVYAALGKILAPSDFGRALHEVFRTHAYLAATASIVVPSLELVLGMHLLLGRAIVTTCLTITLLMPALTAIVVVFGLDSTGCGCFPDSANPINTLLNAFPTTRNAIFAVAAVAIGRSSHENG